jgi:3-oxoacyl-[acyl-carrier protein] reductase
MTELNPSLHGQTAIITGAGTGIGFEIARQLVRAGVNVVLNDIDQDKVEQAILKLESHDGKALGLAGDASDLTFIDEMVKLAVSEFSELNICIANAGITTYSAFLNYTLERFNKLISLNLQGSFFLTQAAAKQMITQGKGGRILLMSSVTGIQAPAFLVPYGMTKAALQMLARGLISELAQYDITVNAIAPGAVATERTLAEDPNYDKLWAGVIPSGKVVMPEDIANAALFLVSPASGQINGQTLVVDGGWTAISPSPSGLEFPEE